MRLSIKLFFRSKGVTQSLHLFTQVPFGVMQSCLEQLIVQIRLCVKVRFLFISLVCIRALKCTFGPKQSALGVSLPHAKMGESKMYLINATSCLLADFISSHYVSLFCRTVSYLKLMHIAVVLLL